MIKSEIELLHNELITQVQLDEIEQSECVSTIEAFGRDIFYDVKWFNVTFVDDGDIDICILKDEPAKPNIKKARELLAMGEVFDVLKDIIDWHYVTDDHTEVEIYTKNGKYEAFKYNGNWSFLSKTGVFMTY